MMEASEKLMESLLFEWLTKEEKSKVRLYVKYYRHEDRMKMYYAMLLYLMTGKKSKFENGAAQWHFRMFCDLIDEVGYSNKAHLHLKMLWEKIGLLERVA